MPYSKTCYVNTFVCFIIKATILNHNTFWTKYASLIRTKIRILHTFITERYNKILDIINITISIDIAHRHIYVDISLPITASSLHQSKIGNFTASFGHGSFNLPNAGTCYRYSYVRMTSWWWFHFNSLCCSLETTVLQFATLVFGTMRMIFTFFFFQFLRNTMLWYGVS